MSTNSSRLFRNRNPKHRLLHKSNRTARPHVPAHSNTAHARLVIAHGRQTVSAIVPPFSFRKRNASAKLAQGSFGFA